MRSGNTSSVKTRVSIAVSIVMVMAAMPLSPALAQILCRYQSADVEAAPEHSVRANLQYHKWSVDVLEQVTSSVSTRFRAPLGAEEKAISVHFDIVDGGAIDGLAILRSSGDQGFDDEFVQAIQILAPFDIDVEYMNECAISNLPVSLEWDNGGSLTQLLDQF